MNSILLEEEEETGGWGTSRVGKLIALSFGTLLR
jgi:hypothetical protein